MTESCRTPRGSPRPGEPYLAIDPGLDPSPIAILVALFYDVSLIMLLLSFDHLTSQINTTKSRVEAHNDREG